MRTVAFACLFAGMLVAAAADAQTTTRLRGNITAIDGDVMSVKSREGKDVKVQLPDNVTVAVAKAIRFDDIKQGDYLGVTTMTGGGGRRRGRGTSAGGDGSGVTAGGGALTRKVGTYPPVAIPIRTGSSS